MRAPALPLAAAFIAGLAIALPLRSALPFPGPFVVLSSGAGLLLGAFVETRRSRLRTASFLVLAGYAAIGLLAGELRVDESESRSLPEVHRRLGDEPFASPARVEGRLRREPEVGPDFVALTLDCETVRVRNDLLSARGGIRARVSGSFLSRLSRLASGDRVALWGTLSEPSFFDNEGGFDGRSYLERERLDLVASVKSALLVTRTGRSFSPASWISRLRLLAIRRLEAALASSGARDDGTEGVLVSLVTGDRARFSPRDEELYRRAGILHVMAISGAHVAIVLVVFYFVLRRLGVDEAPTLAIALVLLPVYATFCGGRAPVVRSVLVATALAGSRLLSLDRASGNALALAALVLLVWEPMGLTDPGFQLSFAAMASILYLSRPLSARLWMLGPLALPMAVSIAAQTAVVPITAWHFHSFTPVAPLVSLLAIPLAGFLVVVGILLVAFVGIPVVEPLLVASARWGSFLLTETARVASSLPGASIAVPRPSAPWVAVYLVAIFAVALGGRLVRALGFAALAPLFVTLLYRAEAPTGKLELTVLDVGHGDALVVRLPHGGRVLVDGGGLPGSSLDVGERVVLPYLLDHGGRGLDAVVVTHTDYDHLGGLVAVASALDVSEIWGGAPRWDRPTYRMFREVARRRGTPVRRLRPRERFELDGVLWEVLSAGDVLDGDRVEEENDRSVVLRLTFGRSRLLLTGDAGDRVEAALLRRGSNLESEVLKVGHHGSRGSTSAAFLERVRPRLAVVSARPAPGRPLPSDVTLARLRDHGIETLRTDESGAITVRLDEAGGIEVSTYRDRSPVRRERR
jgi:competence protein ComEC